jgi:cytochrome c peroxidase
MASFFIPLGENSYYRFIEKWQELDPRTNNPQGPEKIKLGEALFFDPNLSRCGTAAWASSIQSRFSQAGPSAGIFQEPCLGPIMAKLKNVRGGKRKE